MIGIFRRDDLPRTPVPEVGLALWMVADPGNVGTLVRAADALGPAFVAQSEGSADPTGPKALRASMGALFRVPLVGFADAPGRRVALVARGGRPLDELRLSGPTTFVLGAEREGLPDEVLARCDDRATIPLRTDADSLNVAVAASSGPQPGVTVVPKGNFPNGGFNPPPPGLDNGVPSLGGLAGMSPQEKQQKQAGPEPGTDYLRALSACLEGRGYTVATPSPANAVAQR